jgi:chromosome segregation ATPase
MEEQIDALKAQLQAARLKTKAFEAKLRVVEREKAEQTLQMEVVRSDMMAIKTEWAKSENDKKHFANEHASTIMKYEQLVKEHRTITEELEKHKRYEQETAEERNEAEDEIKSEWLCSVESNGCTGLELNLFPVVQICGSVIRL